MTGPIPVPEAARLHQDALEALRRDRDDEILVDQERQARVALEVAWLEAKAG